ncbi:HAMP domain-containing protein [Falsiroseomonas tokyonensis]|uniref:Cache domain-containing protein n=1 Tax=Falsiroseomonas tokyonensis TaxID=430521 RepID=A0ABV7BS60_9PROT|nr:cache domain-containing protein [Falsiroseomonas tokyonensis]MBU8537497.1 cache and HAMP domain-containing protein [Falsiroseomonas tokyonensis]
MRLPFTLGIRSGIFVLCALASLICGGILVVTAAGVARTVTDRESTTILRVLGDEVARQLARSLYVQWRELEGLVRFAQSTPDRDTLRLRLDTIAALNERYAWIGVARPDGQVVVATGRNLEGESVAQRPWFRAGLQGPFAGDVHEAVLLQRLIAPNAAEPLRLIDFAAPLRRADGTITGVIGSHVAWSAVREVVREALQDTGRDVLLVSREGTVLIGPPDLEGRNLSLPSILAARQGATRSGVETWPDGEAYVTAVIAPIAYRNLPSFGWSLVLRQRADAAAAPARAITQRLGLSFIAVAAVALCGSLVLGAAVARPLRRLRNAATALADGSLDGPVPDLRGYSEVRAIADSLARLQAQLPDRMRADAPR